jgi:Transposase DDE domain group 1
MNRTTRIRVTALLSGETEVVDTPSPQDQKGTYEVHGNSTRRLVVASGGDQVVGHVGLHAFGAFADRLGLGNALSSAIPPRGERMPLHDRGKVLVQSMLMLAGGGESCADIEHLRAQEDLFGQTPSDSTVFRTFHEITTDVRDALAEAFAEMRSEV